MRSTAAVCNRFQRRTQEESWFSKEKKNDQIEFYDKFLFEKKITEHLKTV